jgi:RNA polymerase sigma-54 factor
MVSLQPKLSLKVSQRQILTPGLMQMVSVLALNKLELKDMIQAEIAENPVLEELEESVPLLDHLAARDADREQAVAETPSERKEVDPFEEIDFGSYFQEYLDPGFRSPSNFEMSEVPSIENYLSRAGTLSDHLSWQIGSLTLTAQERAAVEYVIGNLNEDGYLPTSDEDLLEGYLAETLGDTSAEVRESARGALAAALGVVRRLDPVGIGARDLRECLLLQVDARIAEREEATQRARARADEAAQEELDELLLNAADAIELPEDLPAPTATNGHNGNGHFPAEHLDLLEVHGPDSEEIAPPVAAASTDVPDILMLARRTIDSHLLLLQKRDLRELARALGATVEQAQAAFDCIRTLDPRPAQKFDTSNARLIEPDVVFVKRGDEYVCVMDEEDVPTLRLNRGYRRLLKAADSGKDVKEYVKERYRSALQLMRNIQQRKNTILRTCEVIVRRQGDFLERGVEALKPMMIKEVAEEIGVHPSTVSRAVSNKYVHTPQGVFELRFFFSEGVNGPEGSGTPLLLLKRKVKKLIEEEDPRKPLTDDVITQMLQAQGIDVTRRTVAKYREDLRIPSTHQRRVRD